MSVSTVPSSAMPSTSGSESFYYLYPDGELICGRVKFTAPGRVSMTDANGTVHSNIPEALLLASAPKSDGGARRVCCR